MLLFNEDCATIEKRPKYLILGVELQFCGNVFTHYTLKRLNKHLNYKTILNSLYFITFSISICCTVLYHSEIFTILLQVAT